MNRVDINSVADWVVARGLAGDDEVSLLHGFCERCVAAGIALTRGVIIIDTLHPVYEGRAFFWAGDKQLETTFTEYGPSDEGENAEGWHRSPFYYLLQSGESEMRRRLEAGETQDFGVLDELRLEGQTDYLAMVQRFDREAAIGEMDCFLSRWLTARPGGFNEAELAALRRLVPDARAGNQVGVAGTRRRVARRSLSRPGCRATGAARQDVARDRGEDKRGHLVFRHARLHRAVGDHRTPTSSFRFWTIMPKSRSRRCTAPVAMC